MMRVGALIVFGEGCELKSFIPDDLLWQGEFRYVITRKGYILYTWSTISKFYFRRNSYAHRKNVYFKKKNTEKSNQEN